MLKKLVCFSLSLLIGSIFLITQPTYAQTKTDNVKKTIISDLKEMKNYCLEKNIPLEYNGKKIKKIEIVEDIDSDTTDITKTNNASTKRNQKSTTVPGRKNMIGDYIQLVSPMTFTGSNCIGQAAGTGPGTLGLSTSYSEAATLSTTASVSSGTVSAAVGFSVTSTYTVTPSYSVNLSAGQSARIYAYPIYKGYTFDIYRLGIYYAGSGYAYRVIGSSFSVAYY